MIQRRWPDVVIVAALLALAGFGTWAVWGEELGLRGGKTPTAPTPPRGGPAAGAT